MTISPLLRKKTNARIRKLGPSETGAEANQTVRN